jgi:cation transport protein ChaC
LAYLDARELPDGLEIVYDRRVLPVRLRGAAQPVQAVTYVARRASRHYCGRLAPETAAGIIARGRGETGSNREYLMNTLAHLAALGMRDGALTRIAALLPPE